MTWIVPVPAPGTAIVSVPSAVPALIVSKSESGNETVCPVIDAPVPPDIVAIGDPGVPSVAVIPVSVTTTPTPVNPT